MASNGVIADEDGLNPFVCTLGEAALRNAGHQHPFPTIPHLLEHQAVHCPDKFAFGIVVQEGYRTASKSSLFLAYRLCF